MELRMTIADVLFKLEGLEDSLVVYCPKPISLESECLLLPEAGQCDDDAFPYFLEVCLMKEVLKASRQGNGNAEPTASELLAAILFFEENDSYVNPVRG